MLLHGLFATTRSMKRLEQRAAKAGYRVENWGYPTFCRSLEVNTRSLLPRLERLADDPSVESIHFIAHSLGGILARYAINLMPRPKFERLVMLAPPNAGSHLAQFSLGPFKKLLPVIGELSESPFSIPNRLPRPSGVEIGIIASASDPIVRIAGTMLPYQADHCVVNINHFRLSASDEVIDKSLNFLATAQFTATPTIAAEAA